jgi:hypothetical protein
MYIKKNKIKKRNLPASTTINHCTREIAKTFNDYAYDYDSGYGYGFGHGYGNGYVSFILIPLPNSIFNTSLNPFL